MTQHGYRLAYDCSGSIAERLVESVRFVPEANVLFLTTTGARRTLRPIGLVMSALGQKQTSRHVRVMSVIPLKADIRRRIEHVCFVPEADIRFQPSSLPTSRSLDAFDQNQFPAA